MKYRCKFVSVILLRALFLISCASREMVSEKSVGYLNKKYNEKFKVVSVNMNHDEGNWGRTRRAIKSARKSCTGLSRIELLILK